MPEWRAPGGIPAAACVAAARRECLRDDVLLEAREGAFGGGELPNSVSPLLRQVLYRATRKSPADRFANCAEMRRALTEALGEDVPYDVVISCVHVCCLAVACCAALAADVM